MQGNEDKLGQEGQSQDGGQEDEPSQVDRSYGGSSALPPTEAVQSLPHTGQVLLLALSDR